MGTKKALMIIDHQNDHFKGGTNPLMGSIEASINANVKNTQINKIKICADTI